MSPPISPGPIRSNDSLEHAISREINGERREDIDAATLANATSSPSVGPAKPAGVEVLIAATGQVGQGGGEALGGGGVADCTETGPKAHLACRQLVIDAVRPVLGRGGPSLAYQPIVNVLCGGITGFEAFVRWRRADGSFTGSAEFMALTGHFGLVAPFGQWFMHTTFEQLGQWHAAHGIRWTISVNLTGQVLSTRSYAQDALAAMKRCGVDPGDVILEIDEAVAASLGTGAQHRLCRLADEGVRLCLDGYGQGSASLELMRKLPWSEVKLMRSAALQLNAVTSSLIHLAKALGMSVVAPGVETLLQQAALVESGCDSVQGALIASPMPAAEVADFVASFR